MDQTNARVLHLMQEMGLSKSELARALEVSPSIMSHITSGRNKVGLDVLQKLSTAFPQVSAKWLLNGEGSMLEGEDSVKLEQVRRQLQSFKLEAESIEAATTVLKRNLDNALNMLK